MYHIVRFAEEESLAAVCDSWMVDKCHVRWAFKGKTQAYRKALWEQRPVPPAAPIFEVQMLSSSGKIFIDILILLRPR